MFQIIYNVHMLYIFCFLIYNYFSVFNFYCVSIERANGQNVLRLKQSLPISWSYCLNP